MAASLREGLEETLTALRLGLPGLLRTTLRSINPIKSAFDKVRVASRNVKRWRNGQQVLRWSAAGLLDAETPMAQDHARELLQLQKDPLHESEFSRFETVYRE